MKYREGTPPEAILNSLYEQKGLGESLRLPPDIRTHYASIVVRLPEDPRRQLASDAIDWTRGWDQRLYYIQRADTLHLTLVDLGPLNRVARPLSEVVEKVTEVIKTTVKRRPSFKLVEPEIGRSGINCRIEANVELEQLVSAFYKKLGLEEEKKLSTRSISLVRYLLPGPEDRERLKELLQELAKKAVEPYGEQVSVKEIQLARLDKVAEYFQVLHQFPV